jgi:tricorn protease
MRSAIGAALPLLCGLVLAAEHGVARTRQPGATMDTSFQLLHQPTVSATHVAFVYGDDLWIVTRRGGEAIRLTQGFGPVDDPAFSPDGSAIAFTANHDGNTDVYLTTPSGNAPRRLTFHPGPDVVVGWSPDGGRVLFRSGRNRYAGFNRLYTIPVQGGFAEELPVPVAEEGSFSPDGRKLAYVPVQRAFQTWKGYRGGRTTPLWIADLATSRIERIPRSNSNDFQPMWRGDSIYFLSDRDGPVTLFSYNTSGHRVRRLLDNAGLDIQAASIGPDAIAYEQFGSVHLFDLRTERSDALQITFPPTDFADTRAHTEKVVGAVEHVSVSSAGDALFEAHGDLFLATNSGQVRDLTATPGIAERDPAWSPDGHSIAYFSDESGEYALHIHAASGDTVRKLLLADAPSFYYAPTWSPDGYKIAYLDKHLTLWFVDLTTEVRRRIDTDSYGGNYRLAKLRNPAWSSDSRWIAYTKEQPNHLRALFLYSVTDGQSWQITDGMSDVRYQAFDRDGRYLYFTAGTDFGPGGTRHVYLAVLDRNDHSPFLTATGASLAADATAGATTDVVRLHPDGLADRVIPLGIPPRNYVGLEAGPSGVVFLLERRSGQPGDPAGDVLYRFDVSANKAERLLEGLEAFEISGDGRRTIYKTGGRWVVAMTSGGLQSDVSGAAAATGWKPGEGPLKLGGLEMLVDPRQEWRQIFREALRIERDFFFDSTLRGVDLKEAERQFAPYIDRLVTRADLNYVLREILGRLGVSHVAVNGGDPRNLRYERVGLLGADYELENDRYRFARVYTGEHWNPGRRAPLAAPGAAVHEGEYLLSVNGQSLRGSDNLYSAFEGLAGKPTQLRVGSDPAGSSVRDVTVTPIYPLGEFFLRYWRWIEDNRKKVHELSNGRIGYLHVPNTDDDTFREVSRYFLAQVDKQALIVDIRFNSGGSGSSVELLDTLQRRFINYVSSRDGGDRSVPGAAIFGPKVMIINQYTQSGGDALAHAFRLFSIGPLVGTRTWGGLIGTHRVPRLIDGGEVTAPDLASWLPDGRWLVENVGVPPDHEIEFDPESWRKGHDAQLEAAVRKALDLLERRVAPSIKRPY